jgi:hypothetical protein
VFKLRFLVKARDFSVLNMVETGSRMHPAFYTKGTEGSFFGSKGGTHLKLTTRVLLVSRLKTVEL